MTHWFGNEVCSWGMDDLIDLLAAFDPTWEDHYYVKGQTIYLFGRGADVSIYIYKKYAIVNLGVGGDLAGASSLMFENPVEAVQYAFAARQGRSSTSVSSSSSSSLG
jgi:hypothetical protein